MAAFDLWTHPFCLGCDKQTDDEAYCSESCRLADFEKSSPSSGPVSGASSPTVLAAPSYPWEPRRSSTGSSSSAAPASSRFYLAPSYDFSNGGQRYGPASSTPAHHRNSSTLLGSDSSSSQQQHQHQHQQQRLLSPSSSYSSLCSLQSSSTVATTAAGDSIYLSDKAKKALREYAISFEHVRLQRRRSY